MGLDGVVNGYASAENETETSVEYVVAWFWVGLGRIGELRSTAHNRRA